MDHFSSKSSKNYGHKSRDEQDLQSKFTFLMTSAQSAKIATDFFSFYYHFLTEITPLVFMKTFK